MHSSSIMTSVQSSYTNMMEPMKHHSFLQHSSVNAPCKSKQTFNNPIKLQQIPPCNKLAIPKKPMRPLTAYHIFFQIEREFIIQNIDGDDADQSIHDNKVFLKHVPRRYKDIKLMPDWYFGPGKRQKRKHRKSHGKIGFLELSRVISSRWANLENEDQEVKKFVQEIAAQELAEYQEEMKEYKELTKDNVMSVAASLPSSTPARSATSKISRPSKVSTAAQHEHANEKSSSSYNLPLNSWRPMPQIKSMNNNVQTAAPRSDLRYSTFVTDSVPSLGSLGDDIDRFMCYTNSSSNNSNTNNTSNITIQKSRKRPMPQCQEDEVDPSSFLSFLDPLVDFSQNDEINAHDHYSSQPESKKQKQRRMSPASVVDICDDEIMKLWKSHNN